MIQTPGVDPAVNMSDASKQPPVSAAAQASTVAANACVQRADMQDENSEGDRQKDAHGAFHDDAGHKLPADKQHTAGAIGAAVAAGNAGGAESNATVLEKV